MVNWKSKQLGDLLIFTNGLVLIILLNILAANKFFRIDLTEEKRYSIKDQTKVVLKNLDDIVYVEVFLEGDLNAQFTRFQKSIIETLEEFRIYSNNRVRYTFTDPNLAMGEKARNEFMADLANRGIQPTNVIDKRDGQKVEKIIFPGAIMSYGGFETGVMLLKGNKARTPEEEINQSIEGVEYELASALYKLTNLDRKQIGLVKGHGESDSLHVIGLKRELAEFYDVSSTTLDTSARLQSYDALIIAKPTETFSPEHKYQLDQYIMRGGKVLFLIDKLDASMDSITREEYIALPYNLNLDDLLFRYGLRININLVQDQSAGLYPIVTGQMGSKPKVQMLDWPFFPLINHYADHPITRNLDAVVTKFVSSIDTVKAEGIKKTPLMFTSAYARTLNAPVNVSVNYLTKNLKASDFTAANLPLAYLLEGSFTSLFQNRFLPEGADQSTFKGRGENTKLIVFADGDLAINQVNPRSNQPQPLGFDPFTNYTFANRDLLLNALAYLVNEDGLIQTRSKEVQIRPLNREKVQQEKLKWQLINLVLPVLLLIVYGIIRSYWRKRKYAQF